MVERRRSDMSSSARTLHTKSEKSKIQAKEPSGINIHFGRWVDKTAKRMQDQLTSSCWFFFSAVISRSLFALCKSRVDVDERSCFLTLKFDNLTSSEGDKFYLFLANWTRLRISLKSDFFLMFCYLMILKWIKENKVHLMRILNFKLLKNKPPKNIGKSFTVQFYSNADEWRS